MHISIRKIIGIMEDNQECSNSEVADAIVYADSEAARVKHELQLLSEKLKEATRKKGLGRDKALTMLKRFELEEQRIQDSCSHDFDGNVCEICGVSKP